MSDLSIQNDRQFGTMKPAGTRTEADSLELVGAEAWLGALWEPGGLVVVWPLKFGL